MTQHMEAEVEEAKRTTEEAKRRVSELEIINDDLENRLEAEAMKVLKLEQDCQEANARLETEREWFNARMVDLSEALSQQQAVEEQLNHKIRRAERNLLQMHQKKHEMLQEARRMDSLNRTDSGGTSQRINTQTSNQEQTDRTSSGRRNQLQDEAMAFRYFSSPSPGLADQQNRVRMTHALSDFFGLS